MRKSIVYTFLLLIAVTVITFAGYHKMLLQDHNVMRIGIFLPTEPRSSDGLIQPQIISQSTSVIHSVSMINQKQNEPTDEFESTDQEHRWTSVDSDEFESTDQEHRWTSVDSRGNTRLFSAYLYEVNQEYPTAILLGLHNHTVSKKPFYCVFQYSNKTTNSCSTYSAKRMYMNRADDKVYWAFRLSCALPDSDQIPTHVGVFQDGLCAPPSINWIPITKSKFDKFVQFGVCIETPIFGKVIHPSVIIEGIERNLALGAEWITVYVQDNLPDTMNVLKHYQKKGVLEIIEWNLSKIDSDNSHYHAEVVSINDCLYRNMLRVKYLVFTDIDEIIVPQRHKNWSEMMMAIDVKDTSAYIFNHVSCMGVDGLKKLSKRYLKNWTCDGRNTIQYPLPLYIRHNYRSPPYTYYKITKTAIRQKTILKPTFSISMGIHTPHNLLNSTTATRVSSEKGLMYHYRISPLCKKCKAVLHDEQLNYLDPELFTRIRDKICEMSNQNLIT